MRPAPGARRRRAAGFVGWPGLSGGRVVEFLLLSAEDRPLAVLRAGVAWTYLDKTPRITCKIGPKWAVAPRGLA